MGEGEVDALALRCGADAIDTGHKGQIAVEAVMASGCPGLNHMAYRGGADVNERLAGRGLRVDKIGPNRAFCEIKNHGCFHKLSPVGNYV